MKLSHRVQTLHGTGADGWAVFYRARQMRADGLPVIELTIGEHDIRTTPNIIAAMAEAAHAGHTGYADIPGIPALRAEVAARVEARTGVTTQSNNVLITAGGQAALFAAFHASCDPGDTALFIDPYYATYPGTIRAAGARPKAVQTRSSEGFLPQETALKPQVAGAKVLLINSPNNPTGAVYPRDTLEMIAQVTRDHDMWLISDEVYDTQVWDGVHLSPRALPDMAERTLVVGSMSKSHAMTGSRLGWIVGPEAAIAHLSNLAINTNYGVPGYIQDAALFALHQGPALEQEVAAPFERRRALALEALATQSVVSALPPQGAMYMMLDIRATHLSGEAFALALLENHHIAVMPGESFGMSAAGHIRVAMTVADEPFAQAFATLLTFAGELAHA